VFATDYAGGGRACVQGGGGGEASGGGEEEECTDVAGLSAYMFHEFGVWLEKENPRWLQSVVRGIGIKEVVSGLLALMVETKMSGAGLFRFCQFINAMVASSNVLLTPLPTTWAEVERVLRGALVKCEKWCAPCFVCAALLFL
jgi:hypothetical protein